MTRQMKDNGTFLDPTELCYPSGSIRQSRRKFRAICQDGKIRSGICGSPDTFFSIPGYVYCGKTKVAGFVTSDDNGFVFYAYTYRKNHHLIAAKA